MPEKARPASALSTPRHFSHFLIGNFRFVPNRHGNARFPQVIS
ncbi:hypothetical protein X805_34610 [Sphaerotilus natans subsp. natans DSM 6575]|uniref:Uncharacterized protein n=1 Tax=Sphaerotilus natans subsp. natans DSM 6575 TaxID=1286631 RepID=A0A059KHU9_9BURK|nr:hypothetical protein X805_34610 [Sphaerotilus natans subsp. natans DSM 6575]